jgi:hypothetical protein
MKKLAICCLVIAAVALLSPTVQAQKTFCYHLTYFCDGVQATNWAVGPVQGTEVVGLWDWVCLGQGTGTLTSGGPNGRFGTQPVYPFNGGTPAGFNANFTFNQSLGVFDLYGTFDGMTTFAFQHISPYTRTKGPCSPLHAKSGLRPATVR